MNRKPHLIFLLAIPFILLIGFLSGDSRFNINVYDTHSVYTYRHAALIIAILFGFMGISYYIMQQANRKLSKWLHGVHVAITFGGAALLWLLTLLYREGFENYKFNNDLTFFVWLTVIVIALGQLLFLMNIIYGLSNKKQHVNL